MSAGAPPIPSRTMPILAVVVGSLMLIFGFIGGVIAAGMNMIGNLDLSSFQEINDGGTVSLNQGDRVFVATQNDAMLSCQLTSGANTATVTTSEGLNIYHVPAAGEYTVHCGSSDALFVGPATVVDDLMNNPEAVATPIMVGMFVSLLGLVLLIVGIVWLVRVNRRRREAVARMQGSYGGFGGGYPGAQAGYGQTAQTQPGYGQSQAGYGQPGQTQPGQTQPGQTYHGGQAQAGYGQTQPGHSPDYGQAQPEVQQADPFAPPQTSSRYADNPDAAPASDHEPPRYGERIDPSDGR